MLGDQIGMGAQAVAGSFDLDHDGVVEQAVEQRGGDDRITEDLAPVGKAAVAGQDDGALFVTGVDQLEEQVGAAGGDRQIADLVDDQERRPAVEADLSIRRPSRSARVKLSMSSASVQR